MLVDLDVELYPDDCQVGYLPEHDQWVYLIFKNGSCSVAYDEKSRYRIFRNEEISCLDNIDIYIRDPKERTISGLNSFVQYTLKDHPHLDPTTVLWMASRYRFLNRHYLPQVLWICNLARYLNSYARLRFRAFEDYRKVVKIDYKPPVGPVTDRFRQAVLDTKGDFAFWWHADDLLRTLVGQEMTWTDLKTYYKSQSGVWDTVTATFREINRVLS